MRYRRFGKLEWESSILGIGVMSLPCSMENRQYRIDESESIRMIRHAIKQGINYLDLGVPWDITRHEATIRVVSNALKEGYREKVKIALTVPALLIKSPEDFDFFLNKQLEWMKADAIDFCLLGRLNRDNWPRMQELGILDRIEKAVGDGRIGKAGFSFHDHYQVLKGILQAYDRWTLCQFQYSYMDIDHDPGLSGISYAADKGLAVVVTEPFKGGRLTKKHPESVRRIWAQSDNDWSLAEWALRFVWNHPGISVVISDMSSMDQLVENLRVADVAGGDSLSVTDEVLISRVRDAFRKEKRVPCPSCRPCMPCPAGIDVPRFFEIYNDAFMYGDIETARALCRYEQIHPGDCTGCRICESRCAKRLSIVDRLARARRILGIT